MSYSRRELYALGEPIGDSATYRKVDGGLVLGDGGGGGGGSSTGSSTQISELPEWARGYAKDTLAKTAAVTDLSQNPYQAYDKDRIAGFSPMQLQSQQGAANMQTSGATNQGIGIAGQAAQQALNTNYQGGGYGNQFQAPEAYQAGRFGAPSVRAQGLNQYQMGPAQQVSAQNFGGQSAQDYMSPYMQNVVDVQQREAQRASDIQGQQNAARAVGQGAFGGSRSALVEAERQRNLATQKGDIQAAGSQAAFNQAQQQFNADQARQMAAQQANQGAGLTVGQQNLSALLGVQQLGAGQNLQAQQLNQAARLQAQQLGEQSRQFGAGQGLSAAQSAAQYGQAANQLNEQANQYGAGLGMQGLQTALQGAGQLGTLGGQQFQQGMDINKLQNAYGGQQQALQQQGLTQAYQDFQNQQNYPYKQLGFMSDMIRGLPVGQATTKSIYEPDPSMAQQVGAIGAGAYGLSKFMAEGGMAYAGGGSVQGYDDGGSVDSADNVERIVSKLSDQQLQQAMQAAQARGDSDQLDAIQSEMAMRASLKNGLASAVTPQMAAAGGLMGSYAGGGILAFAGNEDENGPAGQLVVSPGNQGLYNKFGKLGEEAFNEYENLKPYEAMTADQRRALTKKNFQEFQQFAGADPYAPMLSKIATQDADRLVNLEREKGAAAFEAIPAFLEGRGIRGVAKGVAKIGSGLTAVAKADAAEKRALAQQEFLVKDAERKERMGLNKDALAETDKIEAAGIAAAKSRREALVAKGNLAANLAKAYRPVGTGAGGAGKGPKIAEQLAAAEIAHEKNPTEDTLKEVTALRRAMIQTKTTDVGTQKAELARAQILSSENAKVQTAMNKFQFNPKYLEAEAKGQGDAVWKAELEKQRSLFPTPVTPLPIDGNVNKNSPTSGKLRFDSQGNPM